MLLYYTKLLIILLTINNIVDLYNSNIQFLKDFHKEEPNLQQLKIQKNPLTTLEGIEHMSYLKVLSFANCNICDLTPISYLKQLDSLNLTSNKVSILKPLISCVNLQTIYMEGNQINDINELKCFGSMKKILRLWLKSQSGTNPVCQNPQYMITIYIYVYQSIKNFDERVITDQERQLYVDAKKNLPPEPKPMMKQQTNGEAIYIALPPPLLPPKCIGPDYQTVIDYVASMKQQNQSIIQKLDLLETMLKKQVDLQQIHQLETNKNEKYLKLKLTKCRKRKAQCSRSLLEFSKT